MTVTVTAKDYRPYQGSITVTSGGKAAVIPSGLAVKEGSSERHVPTRYAPNRSQHIYDASLLKDLSSGSIKGILLRRDGVLTNPFVAHKFIFDVHLGSAGVPGAGKWSAQSYKANQGNDCRLVCYIALTDGEPFPG